MDMVASFADNVGVPVPALIPLALVAVAALVFVLDGLSHVVLKPFKSPPVIATLPVVGGMMAFLKGPIGLMANAMPKYGEVFTGACSALSSTGRPRIRASLRGSSNDRSAPRG